MPNSLISKIHYYRIILIKHLYPRNKLCPIDERLRMAICQTFEHLIDNSYLRVFPYHSPKSCKDLFKYHHNDDG